MNVPDAPVDLHGGLLDCNTVQSGRRLSSFGGKFCVHLHTVYRKISVNLEVKSSSDSFVTTYQSTTTTTLHNIS
jgi:hypothetical protein